MLWTPSHAASASVKPLRTESAFLAGNLLNQTLTFLKPVKASVFSIWIYKQNLQHYGLARTLHNLLPCAFVKEAPHGDDTGSVKIL